MPTCISVIISGCVPTKPHVSPSLQQYNNAVTTKQFPLPTTTQQCSHIAIWLHFFVCVSAITACLRMCQQSHVSSPPLQTKIHGMYICALFLVGETCKFFVSTLFSFGCARAHVCVIACETFSALPPTLSYFKLLLVRRTQNN